jgi:amidase
MADGRQHSLPLTGSAGVHDERAFLTALGALRAGRILRAIGAIEKAASDIFDWIPYTPLFNVTGQPAMSVPLCWNEQGLPIGVQFVAKFADDAVLYRLAAQLEQIRPWKDRVPAMARADGGRADGREAG